MWLCLIRPLLPLRRGNTLLTALIVLISILSLTLLAWDNESDTWRSDLTQQELYLNDKWHFLKIDDIYWQKQCQQAQQNSVFFVKKQLRWQAECMRYSLFKGTLPTKKYLQLLELSDFLDLDRFGDAIQSVSHLEHLPHSSLQNPQIVKMTQPIDGRLSRDFYGIILTEYPFHITDKKIYGMLISTVDNVEMGQKRNLTFKREIVSYFDTRYQQWQFLPQSLRLVGYD